MIYRGLTVRELFHENGGSGRRDDGTGRGIEIKEAPLCAACVVEAEIDGVGEEGIVKKGLRRVEKMDGGVTRKRWEVKDATPGQQRKEKGQVSVESLMDRQG